MRNVYSHYKMMWLWLVLLGLSVNVFSHELQPSLLEVRQLTNDQYEINWQAPNYYKLPHPATLELPSTWETIGTPTVRDVADSKLHSRVVKLSDEKIEGSTIRFVGLESTITDVFVRVFWLDGRQSTAIARPNQPWIKIEGKRSFLDVASDYFVLGVDHILSGFDHLTFVLALVLIVVGWRKLMFTVTSFTLAHSITLAAISLGLFWVPGPPVEAVIALSILFLASELIKVNQGKPSLTAKYPWLVAFIFGLLHGFGFAGALTDIGLPQDEVALSLVAFNLGVEVGQLMFIVGVLIACAILRRVGLAKWRWGLQLPAYSIGAVAAFWFIQRVVSF